MTLPQITLADDTPVIAGTTVSIIQILAALAEGATHDAIRTQFPNVTEDDIRAALHYAIGAVETADPTLILEDETLSQEKIEANFKQGWREALRDDTISLEELWEGLYDEATH
jgi:hypothetical protein